MSAIAYIILALAKLLHLVINIYTFVIIISVLLSWVKPDPYNPIVKIIYKITEPVFRLVRKYMPKSFFRTGFDFTPIIVVFALMLIDSILVTSLVDLGRSLLMEFQINQITPEM